MFRDLKLLRKEDPVEWCRRLRSHQEPYGDAVEKLRKFYGAKNVLCIGDRAQRVKRFYGADRKRVTCYDPANPEISRSPSRKFDLVFIREFLEYMEPEYRYGILKGASDLTGKALAIAVDPTPEYADSSVTLDWVYSNLLEIWDRKQFIYGTKLFSRGAAQRGSLNSRTAESIADSDFILAVDKRKE